MTTISKFVNVEVEIDEDDIADLALNGGVYIADPTLRADVERLYYATRGLQQPHKVDFQVYCDLCNLMAKLYGRVA